MFAIFKKIIRKIWPQDPSVPQIMAGSMIDSHSKIGDYTYIGYNCLVTKATIGNYCSIANNCSIGPGEHDLSRISTNSLFYKDAYGELTKQDVTLGHDVWIAANVVVRRGVKIGNGAVIGANSFVNCDIPDFAIFAGTPAKLLKYRFTDQKIKRIQESLWWTLPLDRAKSLLQELESEHE